MWKLDGPLSHTAFKLTKGRIDTVKNLCGKDHTRAYKYVEKICYSSFFSDFGIFFFTEQVRLHPHKEKQSFKSEPFGDSFERENKLVSVGEN